MSPETIAIPRSHPAAREEYLRPGFEHLQVGALGRLAGPLLDEERHRPDPDGARKISQGAPRVACAPLDPGAQLASLVGEAGQVGLDARCLGGQRREEPPPDPGPEEALVRVRGILDAGKLEASHVGPDLLAAAVDQRSDDAIGAARIDPGQPGDARAAEQAREHRLGLVIEGVPHREHGAELRCARQQRSVASLARSGLERAAGRDLHGERRERNLEALRERPRDLDVALSVGAQAMVHRRGVQVEPVESAEDVEERRRVRASGAPDQDARSPVEQGALPDRLAHAREEHAEDWHETRCYAPRVKNRGFFTGVLIASSLALGGAQFRGCGSSDPPPAPEPGIPIPEAMGGCVVDADCASMDMCVLLTCAAGVCVESGVLVDEDGDRYAPEPCGNDCDDDDATVFPGATELCDGVDQDCDGIIDEGAPGIRTHRITRNMANGVVVGRAFDFALIGVPTNNQIGVMLVDADGTPGPLSLIETASPEARPRIAAARSGDGVIVVASAGPDEPPRRYELGEMGGQLVRLGLPEAIGTEADVGRLSMLIHGGQEWVVFDTFTGRRHLWRSGDPTTLIRLANGTQPPVLATDGTLVAVTDGEDVVLFFNSDGSAAGRQIMPGAFAVHGLASGDGFVYGAYRDAFDHALTRVTPDNFTSPTTAPFGDPTDEVQVFFTPPFVLVTRRASSALRAWLYTESLDMYAATFEPRQLTDLGSPPNLVTAGTNDDGLSVIFGAYDEAGSASLAILRCR